MFAVVTFFILSAVPASAVVNDTIKVGLRYGSSAMTSANLENDVGEGYEFGYFDSYLERREELIADVCVPAIVALTERLQTIESVYMFRMFNWTSAGSTVVETEQTYGIFDSPMQPLGVRPKPVALSLFFHFNGVESDPDPLYKYMK